MGAESKLPRAPVLDAKQQKTCLLLLIFTSKDLDVGCIFFFFKTDIYAMFLQIKTLVFDCFSA